MNPVNKDALNKSISTTEDLIVHVFGGPVAGRECGECVMCCKALHIDTQELKKPPDVLCVHNTGTGCGIYETRPSVCRTWLCLWRRIETLPQHMRPDRSGLLLSAEFGHQNGDPFQKFYVIIRSIDNKSRFETDLYKNLVRMFSEHVGIPVYASLDGKKRMVHPDDRLANAIRMDINCADPSTLAKAREWRKCLQLTDV
ncbi:hypothetical protein PQI07_06630 [Methylobacterium sp. 092160098-2]|uniref:YkgJ family cysteine cluster protein n=1 Tax=Methylobacterium sp. 092160098-2 TaxID=3025129 RepID=UPI002381BDA8|nr:hypothetical protein [Methylobacterium sp. 092160098-2]MDE4910377.1 hypothetical protein [Methylobacterium sp. 092160098-2]